MPKSMEGPFAEKLKAATVGRKFPKASPDALAVAEGLDLSGGGKTGREKRRAKHERGKRGDGEGVSGRAVHTRGRFVEAEPVGETVESLELQEAKRLFGEISAQCEALNQLNAFMDANGYKDTEGNLEETVAARLERANQAMLPLKEGLPITPAEVSALTELLKESNQDIADLKEALEGLESTGELMLSPEIKSLFEAKPDSSSPEKAGQGEPSNSEQLSAEKRPYASFSQSELRELWRGFSHEEMLVAVESQVADWKSLDERIRKFGDEARFLDDIRAAETEEDPEEVIRLIGRTRSIEVALGAIRERFEKNGRLDKKDAGTLTALLHPYHELLVAAERLTAEREREMPIVEAEKKEAELIAFLDDNYRRIIRSLKSVKTREQFDILKAEKPDNPISGGVIDADGLRHLFGDRYPENDDKLVEKLLQLSNKFQMEIDALYREVEQRVSAKAEKAVLAANPENASEKKSAFQEKVARLKELLEQWEALEKEFGDRVLRQAIRELRKLDKKVALPPTGKIAKWFAEHDGPKAWQGKTAAADRALLVDDALPGMEGMVRDGQVAAEKLRKERAVAEPAVSSVPPETEQEVETEPPAASVLTLDRRPVIDGKLTEWERMNPVEQNRLRRELFSRKDRFVSGLNERLKRAGVSDGDRRNAVIKYLDEYLPQMIELVVTVPLQDTDREILFRDLKKEIAIA